MNRDTIKEYFGGAWEPNMEQYDYSGWALLDKIPKDARVLDIGCGKNQFSEHFENLIGIDPSFEEADFRCFLEDFAPSRIPLPIPQTFDAILCLGSINFGTYDDIVKQVERVVELLADDGTIYWRLNPGETHNRPEAAAIDFFAWDMDTVIQMADKFNCRVMEMMWDRNNRIYAEWKKR